MSQDLQSDSQIGEYIIEKTLGIGGFGITYLAHDSQLGSQVAIKEYLPSAYAVRDPEGIVAAKHTEQAQKIYQWGLAQFLKEAQALARFKHNNIVRVLRYMEANGTAYMIMEYEPGQSLGALLETTEGTLAEPRLLQVFIPILNGLQAMHQAGLVHLDIKPDNIYICADGRPMLIDFGSASQIAAQKATGQVSLTPSYAAIEHYPDKGERGAWTDIYSIGASMYRCIAGKPPIGAMERYQSILQYKKDPLIPVSALEAGTYSEYVRDCIDWAMEIYPQKRPHSAEMLQQGLMGKGRPGKPLNPPAAPQERSRLAPQAAVPKQQFDQEGNRLTIDPWKIAKWALALLIVIAIGGSAAAWLMRPEPAPPQVSRVSNAEPSAELPTEANEPDAAGVPPEHRAIKASLQQPPARLAERRGGHTDEVRAVFSGLPGDRLVSADVAGNILLWKKGQALPEKTFFAHEKGILALDVSADRTLLASAGLEGTIKLWDSATGAARGTLKGHNYAVYALAFSPDGRWLASAGKDRIILVWDLKSRTVNYEITGHEKAINALTFSPDSRMLASAGEAIRIWNAPAGEPLGVLYAHKGRVLSLDFSADGQWLASAGTGGVIKLWDFRADRNINLSGAPESVFTVRFSPDSHWLASGGNDRLIQVWSVDNGNFFHRLKGHEDTVLSLEFEADGKTLISGARDHKLIFWTQ